MAGSLIVIGFGGFGLTGLAHGFAGVVPHGIGIGIGIGGGIGIGCGMGMGIGMGIGMGMGMGIGIGIGGAHGFEGVGVHPGLGAMLLDLVLPAFGGERGGQGGVNIPPQGGAMGMGGGGIGRGGGGGSIIMLQGG